MAKTHVIDGVTYVGVQREAKVGEKVMYYYDDKLEGILVDVLDVGVGGIGVDYVDKDGYDICGIDHNAYLVCEPIEECCVDTSQAHPSVIDMLANLARRITQLESQMAATQRNLETFAEQTEDNSEDIRELDERTQPNKKVELYLDGKLIANISVGGEYICDIR